MGCVYLKRKANKTATHLHEQRLAVGVSWIMGLVHGVKTILADKVFHRTFIGLALLDSEPINIA